MPTFEFTVSKDVKVVAPDRLVAARALAYRYRTDTEEDVDLGALGRATITDDDEPRITAKRKAKKAPPEGQKAPPEKKSEEKPPQSEVKDACYLCNEDIEEGQPMQYIIKGDITYKAHSVCAAAGGAT